MRNGYKTYLNRCRIGIGHWRLAYLNALVLMRRMNERNVVGADEAHDWAEHGGYRAKWQSGFRKGRGDGVVLSSSNLL